MLEISYFAFISTFIKNYIECHGVLPFTMPLSAYYLISLFLWHLVPLGVLANREKYLYPVSIWKGCANGPFSSQFCVFSRILLLDWFFLLIVFILRLFYNATDFE